MKIKPVLQAEATENAEGGGAPASVIPSLKPSSKPVSSDEAEDSDDVTPADRSLFNKYNKLGQDGKPKRNSTLASALASVEQRENEDEDEDDNEEEEEEPRPKAKKEKKPDPKPPTTESKEETDDDLLNLDVSKIQTARGGPISVNASQAFDKLKKGLKLRVDEIASLKEENEKLKTQLTEIPKGDPELQKKYDALRDEYDTEYFERTDAFKEAYEKPIEAIKEAINGYFEIDPEDKETISTVSTLFKQAADAAAAGKRMTFIRILDKISDDHIEGSNAIKAMFSQDMVKWYEAIGEYTKIYASKDASRKQIIADKMKSRRSEGAGRIITTIDEGVSSFKRNKKVVIDNMPDKLRDEYVKEIDDYAASIKDSVADFQLTGTLTPAITEVLQKGITAKAIEKELGIAWNAFGDLKNKNKILQDENADLKEKLAKLTGGPRSDRTVVKRPVAPVSNGRQPVGRGTSRIAERLRASGAMDED